MITMTTDEARRLAPLSEEEAERIRAFKDEYDEECPPLTDEQLAQMKPSRFRGMFKPVKESVTVRVDRDILAWLKAGGAGYQTRLNAALRWAREHGCPVNEL